MSPGSVLEEVSSAIFMALAETNYVEGYSWLTNEHGLTVDNIVAYQLVLPNGTAITVDETVPDLFFALKVRSSLNHELRWALTRDI